MKFDEKYNKENWTQYFNFNYSIGSIYNQNNIIEKYNDCLEEIYWLGDLNIDENIGVYEIKVKNTKLATKVKLSKICTDIIRSGVRHSYGKGIFFILYSNNDNQYRISYVKYDKKATEDFEVEKDLSDPKRYTYLLGEEVKVKTAQSRLTKEFYISKKCSFSCLLSSTEASKFAFTVSLFFESATDFKGLNKLFNSSSLQIDSYK